MSRNCVRHGCFHPANSQSLEVTPVVVRGMMYVTAANDVFALDARSGGLCGTTVAP